MGMTHGTIAGMLISDLILGKENAWAKLYDPSRQQLHSLGEYVKENANAFAQYKDWVTPGEAKSEDDIPAGQGAIVTHGVMKLAVYKGEDGTVHRCSGVCPHLGGVLRWNAVEKSWDCPLHGSRFDPCGRVLNGPANTDLEPREAPEESRAH
jgi:Rieske Fe-S protein